MAIYTAYAYYAVAGFRFDYENSETLSETALLAVLRHSRPIGGRAVTGSGSRSCAVSARIRGARNDGYLTRHCGLAVIASPSTLRQAQDRLSSGQAKARQSMQSAP